MTVVVPLLSERCNGQTDRLLWNRGLKPFHMIQDTSFCGKTMALWKQYLSLLRLENIINIV